MDLILSSVSQGLLWAIMAIGVYLTFRILDVADLSVEGTFPLGAAVGASLITVGVSPILATFIAFLAGMVGGFFTGFIYTKWKIPSLLAGIVTMTGLYSVNLRIMGQANLTLLGQETLMTQIEALGLDKTSAVLVVGMIAIVIVIFLLKFFFNTEIGLAIRSTGDNNIMSEANGINIDNAKIIGIALGNGLIALSGALLAQNNGYSDVNMGIGAIVIGLASVIIGEAVFKNLTFAKRLITVVIGSIIYRLLLLIVLEMNVNPQDLKLFSAIILAIALAMPYFQTKFGFKHKKPATVNIEQGKGE